MESEIQGLLSGRRLARNSLLNLAGQGAPLLVAVITIPLLLGELGADRFGVLALAWVAIGYFGLFDLGLSRALTHLVADRIGRRRQGELPVLIWTALITMMGLGVLGALMLVGLAPWIGHRLLRLPEALREESVRSLHLLALALPWVISTAGLRGVLEATQRFGAVNAIRVPMGVFTFVGPLLVVTYTTRLSWVVGALVAGRIAAWAAHLLLCLRLVPGLWTGRAVSRSELGRLLGFGGWMTVTNVVGPLMVYFDRFLIGALVSIAAVAYYATPYEVVTKLWLIPTAVLGVVFPAFALSFAADRAAFTRLLGQAILAIWALVFPAVLLSVAFAHEGLTLWLDPEFATHSTRVLQWLAVGVLVNCIGQVPFSAVQGMGRPDLTAKLHLLELPLYGALLWWLTATHGIHGAAIAWTCRVVLDTLLLFLITGRLLPRGAWVIRRGALLLLPSLVVLAIASLLDTAGARALYVALSAMGLCAFVWLAVATEEERALAARGAHAMRRWGPRWTS